MKVGEGRRRLQRFERQRLDQPGCSFSLNPSHCAEVSEERCDHHFLLEDDTSAAHMRACVEVSD